MSGYLALENCSPLLNLVVGLTSFIGIWGCGQRILRNASLPAPWDKVTGVVLGVLLFGCGCQLIAFFSVAARSMLGLYLLIWTIAGFVFWSQRLGQLNAFLRRFHPWMLLFLIPAAVLLVMAISGSTKGDETFYHMLMPARIVAHEGLVFFSYPWQSAVPQMGYQIAQAPFHAIGFPHAGNVMSWMLALVFAFFAYSLVKQRHRSTFWASLVPATLLVGMYPMVWYVTGGAHALRDLAVASCPSGKRA